MKNCKVALVQMDSGESMEENLRTMEQRTRKAAKNGANLVIFPETVEYIGPGLVKHASKVPGELTVYFSELARECGVWLHAGSITEKYEKKSRNTTLFFSPEGELRAKYSKTHMFDVAVENGPGYRESDKITPGDAIVLADTPFGRLGFSICYDLRFPELFRLMAYEGAEVMIVSANFTDPTGRAHWEPLLKARAIENACYVLACDQCGEKPAFKAHGHSMIIDPWGKILAEAGEEEEIIYADLDAAALEKTRAQIPALFNVRKDLYTLTGSRVEVK